MKANTGGGTAGDCWMKTGSSSGGYVYAKGADGVELHHAGTSNKKFETTSSGATVTGTLTATTFSGSGASLTSLPAANLTGNLPAISGANLTNLPTTDPSNSDIQVVYTVTANGSSAYRFGGNGIVSTADNPDVYLIRGLKYRFINNSGGSHPFQIRESSGGSAYSSGVTNNGASSGNIDFQVPYSAPSHLYYQCTSHGGMVGNLYIRGAGGGNTNVGVTTFSGGNVSIPSGSFSLNAAGTSRFEIASIENAEIDGEIAHSGDTDTKISFDTNTIKFDTGGGERLRIASDGEIFMGANFGTTNRSTLLSISGANQDPAGVWTQVGIYADGGVGINKGGSIGFGGPDGSTAQQQFSAIKGAKENSTSGNYAGYMAFYTRPAGAVSGERLRITSDGKVVAGGSGAGYPSRLQSHGAGNLLDLNSTSGACVIRFYESGAGRFDIRTNNGSSGLNFYDSLNGVERLRIDNGGRIMTGGYSSVLDSTNGSIQINGDTSGGRLSFRGTSTSAYAGLGEMHGFWDTNKVASILFHAGSDTSNKDDGELRFYTRTSGGSASARLRIDSSGRSLFRTNGSQTDPVADNNIVIQIAESTAGMCYIGFNKSGSYGSIIGHHTAFGGTVIRNVLSGSDINFYTNNTSLKFKIESDGHIHAPSLNSGSGHNDVRYNSSNGEFIYNASTRLIKTDIEDCSYGLAEIKQLKPRIYKRTDADNVVEIGFIADEVQPILPEICATEKKSFFTKNESDSEIIPSNWDSKCLAAVLTKAIQEQQEQIEILKAKVAALDGS